MTADAILVTGGAGYIGSHCCKALASAGFFPVSFDSLERGHRQAVKWGPLEEGNILDERRLGDVVRKYRPRAVMHFAAYAYVGESVEFPEMYRRNNVEGSQVLLSVMRSLGVPQIVFSSSCATYGIPQSVPIDESHSQHPISPYGDSKLAVERMLKSEGQEGGLRSISLRYFNAAGASPDGDIGEAHEPETHLIPRVLQSALGTAPEVTIHGDDYATADGTCVRDFVHVSDLAEAHVLALRSLPGSESTTRALNLGNGTGYSVREVIEVARKVTGREIAARVGPRREGDAPALVANASRARLELGWIPHRSSLENVIESAWQWMNR